MEAESILPLIIFATYFWFRFHNVRHPPSHSDFCILLLCFLSIILRQFHFWKSSYGRDADSNYSWALTNSGEKKSICRSFHSWYFLGSWGESLINFWCRIHDFVTIYRKWLMISNEILSRSRVMLPSLVPDIIWEFRICNCLLFALNRTVHTAHRTVFVHSSTWMFVKKRIWKRIKEPHHQPLYIHIYILLGSVEKKSFFC